MKYRVDLKKVEYVPATVFAASPEEAVANAVAGLPGFKPEYVTALIEEDEEGECHSIAGSCEACHKALLDGNYKEDGDELLFCPTCYEEMSCDFYKQP